MISIIPFRIKGQYQLILSFPCVILLITRGEGHIDFSGHQVEIQPERIVFFCNRQLVELEGALEGFQLGFEQTLLDVFLFKLQSPGYQWLKYLDAPAIDQSQEAFALTLSLVEQIKLLVEQKRDFRVLQKYLMMLLTHFNIRQDHQSWLDPELSSVQQMMELIEEHFKEHRETDFYAHKMGMNPRSLNALSKKYRDKRFFEVLMERLLLEADVLLLEDALSIKDIAYELGFSSHTHFTTYYSRFRKCSPTTFRQDKAN